MKKANKIQEINNNFLIFHKKIKMKKKLFN